MSFYVAMSRELLEDLLFKGHIAAANRQPSALEKVLAKESPFNYFVYLVCLLRMVNKGQQYICLHT